MRALLTLAALLLLAGLAAGAGVYWFAGYARGEGPLQAPKTVFIAPGTGVRAMAATLAQEGAIDHPYTFMAVVRVLDVGGKLKAGEYALPARIPLVELVDKIARGDVLRRAVTVPEGLSSYDVMGILNNAEAMNGTVAEVPPEGSVLPETYAYIRNDDRGRLLASMQAAMTRTVDELWDNRAPDLPFATKAEAVALASVVEKETGIASERARIAGVFVNRLRMGMMLQSDPTVIYAVTGGRQKLERVLYAHLAADSPYNTYKYKGIPPGPICNPGRAAIEAVLNPEKNDYIYFVADGTGGHVFARSVAEHNANVVRWRAVQRAQRQP